MNQKMEIDLREHFEKIIEELRSMLIWGIAAVASTLLAAMGFLISYPPMLLMGTLGATMLLIIVMYKLKVVMSAMYCIIVNIPCVKMTLMTGGKEIGGSGVAIINVQEKPEDIIEDPDSQKGGGSRLDMN